MPLLTPRRFAGFTGLFALVSLAAMLAAPMVGAEPINTFRALAAWLREPAGAARSTDVAILIELRLPRILMGFLTGAALAVVGAVFQALLRNPLATPYTLGVASGGSLGAVIAIFLPGLAFAWGPFNSVQIFSFVGSSLGMMLIYLLARSGDRVSPMELLLAGVTLGMIFSALILAVRYFAAPQMLVGMDRWMMGGLDGSGYREVWAVLPLLIPGLIILMRMARGLDQISFGEELASGRGVNVARLQKLRVLLRLAGGGLGGRHDRPDRLRRPAGAPHGASPRRPRPPVIAAVHLPSGRRVSGALRYAGPLDHRPHRAARRHHHLASGRPVLHLPPGAQPPRRPHVGERIGPNSFGPRIRRISRVITMQRRDADYVRDDIADSAPCRSR